MTRGRLREGAGAGKRLNDSRLGEQAPTSCNGGGRHPGSGSCDLRRPGLDQHDGPERAGISSVMRRGVSIGDMTGRCELRQAAPPRRRSSAIVGWPDGRFTTPMSRQNTPVAEAGAERLGAGLLGGEALGIGGRPCGTARPSSSPARPRREAALDEAGAEPIERLLDAVGCRKGRVPMPDDHERAVEAPPSFPDPRPAPRPWPARMRHDGARTGRRGWPRPSGSDRCSARRSRARPRLSRAGFVVEPMTGVALDAPRRPPRERRHLADALETGTGGALALAVPRPASHQCAGVELDDGRA